MMIRMILMTSVLWSISLVAVGQEVTDGEDVPSLSGFDDAILNFMVANNVPDAQLAVTWQGRLVLARSYSNGSSNPVDNRSRFRVASVSKPLTSTLLHRLQQDGALDLDQPIADFLDLTPALGQMADERLSQITVRHLLQHLSGLKSPGDLGFDPVFNDRNIAASLAVPLPIRKSHIQRFMHGQTLDTDPGTEYDYSNYGYLLAGEIIEEVTGVAYGAYVDRVFNPLGIFDSRRARSERQRAYAGEAVYSSGFSGFSAMDLNQGLLPYEYGGLNYENQAAGGGWTLSMVEAARWLSSLDRPDEPHAVLDESSLQEMFGLPENHSGSYNPGDYYYGSGWGVRDYGSTGFNTFHNGSLPGTTAYVVRIRDGFNFAVALNRRNEQSPGALIAPLETAIINARNSTLQWPAHDLFESELPAAPEPVSAVHGGSWYDPTHAGEGFIVSMTGPETAVIYWFTYTPEGEQAWYFGSAQLEGHRLIAETLYETSGGRFGPDFDPDEVQVNPVGSLVINVYNPSSAKADYLLNGESGFQELARLTRPIADASVSGSDWRTGLWYDPTHSGEGYVVEVLPGDVTLVYWFTYDNAGNPAWMLATGSTQALEQGISLELLRPVGGNFGIAFNPDRVVRLPNGNGTLSLGCGDGSRADYSGGDAPWPAVELSLVRLAGFLEVPCP